MEKIHFFSESEYQKIADVFGLGSIKKLKRFKQGLAAPKVLVITRKGKYVIAKYKIGKGENFKSKPRKLIQHEIDLLTSLRGLPIPKYVSYKNKSYIFDFKGFGVTVYKYLHGRATKTINHKKAFALGKFLGGFHKQERKFKDKFVDRYKFYDFSDSRMKTMRSYVYDQTNKELKSVVKEVKKGVISNRPSRNLPRGPIHVDIKSDNELFEGNKLTGIIDFGNFYMGPLILDVGKAIMFNCVKNGKLDYRLIKKFLLGYEKQRVLNRKERDYLKKSMLYAIYSHIWLDLYHVPLKLVPTEHTLYFVRTFLPAVRELERDENFTTKIF